MKIMIFDQGHTVAEQMLAKALAVFGQTGGSDTEIVIAKASPDDYDDALDMLEKTVGEERPQILLIGATALGEELAPALGIRLRTGVAAHCIDMFIDDDGQPVFMIPAFGGRVVGEIMVPGAEPGRPAVASVKPDAFASEREVCGEGFGADMAVRTIDLVPSGNGRGFRTTGKRPLETTAADIGTADLVLCGGYGLGSEENWKRLETIASALGGAAGCTRPVADAGWGADENSMIGTSGRSVKPKMYVGFGISGAAHHLCGIRDAETIININRDRNTDAFGASDYKGVFDAGEVLKALEKEIGL